MGAATLDQMAINGGMPQTGAATSFYQVTDTASLVAALQTILGRVGSCQFEIGAAPNSMTSNDLIDVFGDGDDDPARYDPRRRVGLQQRRPTPRSRSTVRAATRSRPAPP